MKTLIIYAHPKTKGHNPFILETVKKQLIISKQEFEVIDLYSIKYDPVMHEDEHYTSGNYNVSKQNKEFQEKISKAEDLIFIYPIWWNTMPAILKGFIDKVFTSHFAFTYEGSIPKGLLKGKKAAVFITGGGPVLFAKLTGDRAAKIIKKDILKFCGIRSKVFQIGNSRQFTEEREEIIIKTVKKGLGYLF